MLKIYNIKDKPEYIEEVAILTQNEWGSKTNTDEEYKAKISKKINKLPLKYFDSHETGDVLSRVTNDVDTIAQNLNNSLATIVTSGTLWLGCIFMLFITNWILALTAILSSVIGLSLMFLILNKSQKYFIERNPHQNSRDKYFILLSVLIFSFSIYLI